jgi:hypothetical protein
MRRPLSVQFLREDETMRTRDDDINIRPGRIQHGNRGAKRPTSFVGEVHARGEEGRACRQQLRPRPARGIVLGAALTSRRVVIKSRVVCHRATLTYPVKPGVFAP